MGTSRLTEAEKAQRLADFIKRAVDAAPPLTVEQCEDLARILRPRRVDPVSGPVRIEITR